MIRTRPNPASGEPTRAQLAAIEAERPVIEAELAVVDAECAFEARPDVWARARVRRAEADLDRICVDFYGPHHSKHELKGVA